ncbi:hypothetical protein J4Q44_G00207880 [Coregonus suidteri]|uniref:Secretory carrier membrane protein n=1 Tax=Coregonus suidteri TaxID=861788 RepID=A0AAN8LNE9_9TELE
MDGVLRRGLWPVHPLAHPVHPLLLPLLVQTCLQGLQVGQLLQFLLLLFSFVFFCQVVVFIIQSVGIPRRVGAIMMVVAYFFTNCAVLSIILLRLVHSQYRRTGASFQKAQQEFFQGVLTNKTFQTAAASGASSAASGAFQGNS